MKLREALAADREGELPLAAARYEEALAGGEASLEVLLDLAVLCWQATDAGTAAGKKLSPDFLATAGRRFPELLAEAQRRFPTSAEPRFWKRHIAWADLCEPFGRDECRELLREDRATLVPAMQLFAVSRGKEAEADARELLRRCEHDGTTRARYVASVIQGVLKRTHGNMCLVCGLVGLEAPAYDSHGCASFEICSCCGTEFGYDDATRSHAELRAAWIEGGMKWQSQIWEAPADRDPVLQLQVFDKR